ncbi:SANT associated domain-containing protein [Strongyloides ratti]|uniref:SANT associated domain-containing protein n=1 Tax=Strongyloides ratti TaxID=34506 RepID=A0A090LGI2_STRRB|nr:SANT associated domain-containing protein [Strongyloides ratti]CEF66630.1 SANT associated domain-containing protein [Strongyloides ratti]
MKFVKLSNWFIKFIEGNYDDFDIVLEGIAGKNDMFLPLNSYYISTPIIYIGKYNEILCDGNILIELESSINKNKMKNMGFSLEFISCFKYGFPTNWVNITDDFYLKFKKNNDLSISHQLVEVALREMNEYKVTYLESAVNIVDWYLRIHPCENEDDFHVILKGQIKDYTNHSYNDVSCEDVICDRETFDIILCGRTQLYKLVAPINVKKMKEYGYPEELINCFKFGFPSNWFQLWLDIKRKPSDSKFFKTHQYSSNDVKKGFIELECEGMLDVESSLSSSLLSSSFVSTNDSVSPLPNTKKPIWNDLEISENIFSLKGFLTNDFLQHNSLSSSVSLVNSLDIPNDTSKLFNSSLKAEDKNKETQMTDFFALTNKFSSFSQISDSEHVAKFEGMDKTSKKIMNNNDQIINNSIDTEELFDASLDLADMENSSRDDSTIKTKPLVYYIPAVKHISKSKKKSTKIKKREPVEIKFNFEKLVYEEIERYKNSSLDKVYFDEDSSLKNLF